MGEISKMFRPQHTADVIVGTLTDMTECGVLLLFNACFTANSFRGVHDCVENSAHVTAVELMKHINKLSGCQGGCGDSERGRGRGRPEGHWPAAIGSQRSAGGQPRSVPPAGTTRYAIYIQHPASHPRGRFHRHQADPGLTVQQGG